jgi:hypothetical protein
MTTLIVGLSVVLVCVLVAMATRRRREARDLRAAQRDQRLPQHIAGVFGLGEAPQRVHHRMGTAGQRRRD